MSFFETLFAFAPSLKRKYELYKMSPFSFENPSSSYALICFCFQAGAETFKHCTIEIPVEEDGENGTLNENDENDDWIKIVQKDIHENIKLLFCEMEFLRHEKRKSVILEIL